MRVRTLVEASTAYREGRNVAETLRTSLGAAQNTPEIILATYHVQAGSYVDFANDNPSHVRAYAAQLAKHLDPHLRDGDRLLDAGAGELTTLSHLVTALKANLSSVIACDISSRRLAIGRAYAARHMPRPDRLTTIPAEMGALSFPDGYADVVTTNHALEPNGGREAEILAELLRVGKKLVLFEPCYEIATAQARRRMDRHGYARDLEGAARRAGGRVESVTPILLVDNPMNPTACFVIAT